MLAIIIAATATMIYCYINRFDPQEYVQAFLDVSYKQKTESYIKQTGISEKEAKQVFEDNLAYTMEKFPEHVMTDEMTEEYRELFADLAKKTSYTVGEAIREENGTYQVVLTVKPITLLKDTYAEFQEKAQEYATKVSNDVMNGQAMPEETQMQTEIYQIYYEVLSQAAEKGLKYGKPNKIVLHVEKDKEGKYEIRKADLQNLDHLLIESVGEEQDEDDGTGRHQIAVKHIGDNLQGSDPGSGSGVQQLCTIGQDALNHRGEDVQQGGSAPGINAVLLTDLLGDGAGHDDGDCVVGRSHIYRGH